MSDQEWYYADGEEQKGPVPLAELRKLVAAGRVSAENLVWCEEMADWEPAGTVKALALPKPAARHAEPKKAAVPAGPRPAKKPDRWAEGEIAAPAEPSLQQPSEPQAEPKKPKKLRSALPTSDEQAAAQLEDFGVPGAAPEAEPPIAPPEPPEFAPPEYEPSAEPFADEELPPDEEPVTFHKQRPAGLPRLPRRTEYVPVPMPAEAPQLGKFALAIQLVGWGCCALALIGAIVWFAIVGLRGEGAGSATSSAAALFAFSAAAYAVAHAVERMAAIMSEMGR